MTKEERIEIGKHIQDMCYDVLNLEHIYLSAKKTFLECAESIKGGSDFWIDDIGKKLKKCRLHTIDTMIGNFRYRSLHIYLIVKIFGIELLGMRRWKND